MYRDEGKQCPLRGSRYIEKASIAQSSQGDLVCFSGCAIRLRRCLDLHDQP